jgi:hypothetical protein
MAEYGIPNELAKPARPGPLENVGEGTKRGPSLPVFVDDQSYQPLSAAVDSVLPESRKIRNQGCPQEVEIDLIAELAQLCGTHAVGGRLLRHEDWRRRRESYAGTAWTRSSTQRSKEFGG